MNITPLRDLIVATLLPDPTPKASLIQLVELAPRNTATAHVDAVGPDVRDTKVGQRVVISRLQGTLVGDDRVVLRESAVLAYVE